MRKHNEPHVLGRGARCRMSKAGKKERKRPKKEPCGPCVLFVSRVRFYRAA